jgi:DNA-binding response OmpR family regulator
MQKMKAGRVLIVNSFDGGDMYAEHLTHHGFEVHLAARPEDIIDQLGTIGADAIVSDAVFLESGYTGARFVQLIRRRRDVASVPVIMISGFLREEDRRRAREAGADRFLAKPCLPEALLAEVQRAVEIRRQGMRPPWNWPEQPADRRRQDRRLRERRRTRRRKRRA